MENTSGKKRITNDNLLLMPLLVFPTMEEVLDLEMKSQSSGDFSSSWVDQATGGNIN